MLGTGTFTPSTDVGLCCDAGDAETGTGVEAGGGMRNEGDRWSIQGSARMLFVHEAGGYEEWGASGSIRIDPDVSGRGISLTVALAWGAAGSKVEGLWSLSLTALTEPPMFGLVEPLTGADLESRGPVTRDRRAFQALLHWFMENDDERCLLAPWERRSGPPRRHSRPRTTTGRPEMTKELLQRALWLFDDDSRSPQLFGSGRPSMRNPPPKPGLYRLIRTHNGEIWYIGQASNLARRISEHKKQLSKY